MVPIWVPLKKQILLDGNKAQNFTLENLLRSWHFLKPSALKSGSTQYRLSSEQRHIVQKQLVGEKNSKIP